MAVLQKRLETLFSKIMLNTKVVKVAEEKNGIRVTFEGGGPPSEEVFDRVLVAVGRRPNSKIPGLETTGVKVDAKGFIETDGQRRTAEPTIFAIGDVAGEPMLAHKASHEARVAVEAIQGHRAVFEPLAIPAVVFTDPEIAWTGLTEAQAQADGRDVEVAKFPWAASGRAITIDRPDGLTKLVLDKKTGRILGVGIAGSGAGELIAEGTLAIEMGATAEDLKMTIHPHPTLSETLMESAEVFFGQSTHVYKPNFVGMTEYSAWALTTSQGIILIDAIYDYSVEDEVVGGLKKLGLNPADVKYVLVSHAHSDHYRRRQVPARPLRLARDPVEGRLGRAGSQQGSNQAGA